MATGFTAWLDPHASVAENLAQTQDDWRGGPRASLRDIQALLAGSGLSRLAASGVVGFDVPSGCVWDAGAIQRVEKLSHQPFPRPNR